MNKVKLSSIIDIISGGTPKTDVKQFWEKGTIGWLSVTDFNNDLRYVYSTEKQITDEGLKNSNTKLLNKGDIIISARGTVGALAQIGTPMCFNQSCFGLRGKRGIVETDFLYYALKNYVHNIKKRSQGSVFDTINLNSFDLMEIEIPKELSTQQKIASVLSALDAKIELNNRINAELEAMAKTLYDYWFVQFDFPIYNQDGTLSGAEGYKTSGGTLVWNEELKREIPEGWEVKNLQEIAKCIMGQSPKGESYNQNGIGTPLLNGPADYENGALKGRTFTTEPTRLCQKNDLVLCIRATIGNLVYSEQEFCLGRGVAAVRANDKRLSELIYFLLIQEIERFKVQATGSIIVGITKDDLIESKCLIAKDDIIHSFHSQIKPQFDKIRINKKENQKLTELRDWLLPMLMNGQVKVN